MRIGIDCRLWNESGVGRYIRNLVTELARIDKKNEYLLFLKRKEFELLEIQGKNFEKKLADIRWHTVSEQIKFKNILEKQKLDLVHFPYFSVPVFYKGPYVVTIHDLILDHFPTGEASTLITPLYKLKHFGYKFVIKKAAKNAQKIITVSASTKNEIIDHLGIPGNKIVVTYEGVDDKLKVQDSKPQTKNQNYFLYVGNAYPHKNLEKLIDACRSIIIEHPDIQLILVGKDDYFYKRLKKIVREKNLESNIIFFGQATDKELSQLYQNAKALILPSLMEGFGLPGLEAMANNCLVLASNIEVFKEIYSDVAIYFDPKNAIDIAQKMKDLISKDINNFNKNLEKGLERVKDFSWEKMAKETLEVYESGDRLRSG